jgi:CheY-like chemotaxis protein
LRVLVVEPSGALARLLPVVLCRRGHTAHGVEDRAAALNLLRTDAGPPFEVCLVHGFGADATEPSAEDRCDLAALEARLPVVLYTAHRWATDLGPEGLGVSAVLPLPFTTGQVLAAVETAVTLPKPPTPSSSS